VKQTLVICCVAFTLTGCYTSAALANSCANVDVMGLFDESGLRESAFGIYAAGTFRIAGEEDESKQPMFNLSVINCERQTDDTGKESLECKVTQAIVSARSGNPDPDNPNCSLDLETSTYTMKELQKGVLAGISETAACINTMLTIDRNTKRIYFSFTKTEGADKYDKIRQGTCGSLPRTEVLMNCTGWPRIRKQGRTAPRYCDFSGSGDK
jgi:hypothetical protein